jgi:hypothetical protein
MEESLLNDRFVDTHIKIDNYRHADQKPQIHINIRDVDKSIPLF